MSIKTHNNYAWSAMGRATEVLEKGSTTSGLKQRIEKIWKLYIDRYFYDGEKLWHSRKEPYIYYKHLFRKFIYENVTDNKLEIGRIEKYCCGKKPHHTTIANSVKQEIQHIPVEDFIIEDITNFLETNLEMTLDAEVRFMVREAKNRGYIVDDIARNCYVHEDAIYDLLEGKVLPTNILNQIKRELS